MKDEEKPISLKFILFVFAVLAIIVYYISLPNDIKKLKKSPTFQEQLEYRDKYTNKIAQQNKNINTAKQQDNNNINNNDYLSPPAYQPPTASNFQVISTSEERKPVVKSIEEYNTLLDKLKDYPAKSADSVQLIVNEILKFKGYPENIVRVYAGDIDQSKSKSSDSYLVANFDFSSGYMNISNKMLYALDNKELIAILAHELDHFDKIANTCKSMGIDNFSALFTENGYPVNRDFWIKASSKANDINFDKNLYQDALKRYINQNDLEHTSSYSDFYRLSESIRNPLEVSAYKVSDYVYDYYKLKNEEGPIKKLVKKFNAVDIAVYNFVKKHPELEKERVAIFDYYFMNAILAKMPQFSNEFNKCVKDKNGDLSSFWITYENSVRSFYHKGTMDNQTYDKIYSLMEETEKQAKQTLTKQDVVKAFKYKINTLAANLVYPNAVKNLRAFIVDYLNYVKKENIIDDEQELKSIIMLFCIDNELYTNNKDKEISLYYLKMPDEIATLYNVKSKKSKYLFIYNHPAFKNKRINSENEQNLLIDLINKNRLDVRIKD